MKNRPSTTKKGLFNDSFEAPMRKTMLSVFARIMTGRSAVACTEKLITASRQAKSAITILSPSLAFFKAALSSAKIARLKIFV